MNFDNEPVAIASTQLWMRKLAIPPQSPEELQSTLSRTIDWTGVPLIGCYAIQNSVLTLLKWPVLENSSIEPSNYECDGAATELMHDLDATEMDLDIDTNQLHSVMTVQPAGSATIPRTTLQKVTSLAPNMDAHESVIMTSKSLSLGSFMSTTVVAPATLITGAEKYEFEIHRVAQVLQQHFYAIERPTKNRTDLYQS